VPGGIFLRAIVRAYAQEVGADPEPIVRDLIASFPADATGVSQTSQIDYEKATTPRRGLRGVLAAAVVLVVVLIAFLIWLRATMGW
jgi:cytoskeletal protein RodZ